MKINNKYLWEIFPFEEFINFPQRRRQIIKSLDNALEHQEDTFAITKDGFELNHINKKISSIYSNKASDNRFSAQRLFF